MTEKYLSVYGDSETRKVIEKSKFITTSRHVESEDEARAFIAEVCSKYPDATHNCFAYIPDIQGNFPRFSDDGEPQGTAGMPMLEVIKNKRLVQVCTVVTRYFGGIKLGAGGLVRAYSGCVSENLDSAQKVLYETCAESVYRVDYSGVEAATRFFSEQNAFVLNAEYSNEVVFTVAVKKSEEREFNVALSNRLCGKVKIEKMREYFFPFKIQTCPK